MSKRESISRYTLIINKLRKHTATYQEIADYLSRESETQDYNFNVSKRTFQRDLVDIRSMYDIDIQYDQSEKVYFIFFEDKHEMNERMFEAFDTFNALNLTARLSDYIHFEKRRPQGTENLYGLLHAIKNRFQIEFTYQKFWEDVTTLRTLEPYALKEFKNRWYVLGKDLKDNNIKSFALDRLSNLDITKRHFQYPADYNVNDDYRYCFGIISPNGLKPEEIILSFEPFQGKYIKTLPLHHTQQVLVDNEDELQIKLKLCITFDFEMELLSYGNRMKVLQPQELIDKLKTAHLKAYDQYRNE
jgi:predicted DNA-binding transcriptional regulator YafY